MVTVLAAVGVAAGLAPAAADSWQHGSGAVRLPLLEFRQHQPGWQAAPPASGPGAVVWDERRALHGYERLPGGRPAAGGCRAAAQ